MHQRHESSEHITGEMGSQDNHSCAAAPPTCFSLLRQNYLDWNASRGLTTLTVGITGPKATCVQHMTDATAQQAVMRCLRCVVTFLVCVCVMRCLFSRPKTLDQHTDTTLWQSPVRLACTGLGVHHGCWHRVPGGYPKPLNPWSPTWLLPPHAGWIPRAGHQARVPSSS